MPKEYSRELQDLIKSLLNHNPDYRPSVSRIIRNSYIRRNIAIFLDGTYLSLKNKNVAIIPPGKNPRPCLNSIQEQQLVKHEILAPLSSSPLRDDELLVEGKQFISELQQPHIQKKNNVCSEQPENPKCEKGGISHVAAVVKDVPGFDEENTNSSSPRNHRTNFTEFLIDGHQIRLHDKFGEKCSDGSCDSSITNTEINGKIRTSECLIDKCNESKPEVEITLQSISTVEQTRVPALIRRPIAEHNSSCNQISSVISMKQSRSRRRLQKCNMELQEDGCCNAAHDLEISSPKPSSQLEMPLNGGRQHFSLIRPPNSTARQRRRLKLLQEHMCSENEALHQDDIQREDTMIGSRFLTNRK